MKANDADNSPTTSSGRVSIIIPTYREAENLPLVAARIAAAMSAASHTYEIIIVDDDSRDGTDRAVSALRKNGCPVRLITRIGSRDLSSAVILGFSEATGDTLVCMDGDLSHPPEVIPRLVARLADPGVELVLGSRYVDGGSTDGGWGLMRWLNSRIAIALARPFTSVRDPMSGFFGISKQLFEKAAPLDPVGYKIALELIVKCNCSNIGEVPIHFAKRQFGRSKLSTYERVKYLRHLGRLLRYKLVNGRASDLRGERAVPKAE